MADSLLWQQLKSGDKTALEQIYRLYIGDLLRYGLKFSSDQQLVEDCIQDLFVELWRNRGGLSQTTSIRKYILVAVRRKIIRQSTQRNRLSLKDDASSYDFEVEFGVDQQMVEAEEAVEQSAALQTALTQLSKRQKEAIYLKYQLGMDYEDICALMEISYQSARNLISAGLRKLKTSLRLVFWLFAYCLLG